MNNIEEIQTSVVTYRQITEVINVGSMSKVCNVGIMSVIIMKFIFQINQDKLKLKTLFTAINVNTNTEGLSHSWKLAFALVFLPNCGMATLFNTYCVIFLFFICLHSCCHGNNVVSYTANIKEETSATISYYTIGYTKVYYTIFKI